jgi:hypothetical protein
VIVIKDTPLEVGWLSFPTRVGQWSVVIAAKATFDIPVDGTACALSAEQAPIIGDVYEDDDPQRALKYAADLTQPKAQAETYLIGTCHAPHGRAVTTLLVAFRVGGVGKELAVIGDRYWVGGLLGGMGEPEPFTSMPLSWERSFGGKSSKANPAGRGLEPIVVDGSERYPLPNIEDRAQMMKSSQARPEPFGAFPIPPTWARRVALAGTFDSAWQRSRWPYFPTDVSPAYFNVAPNDLRIVGSWRGDEPIDLVHLHPLHPRVHTTLPGIAARCLVVENTAAETSAVHEVPLALDTIVIDADAGKIYALWRGTRAVRSKRHEELETLFLTHDPIRAPRDKAGLERAYAAELGRRAAEERDYEAVPIPGGKIG